MPSNEEQIRNLIERWAEAVHAGDLPTSSRTTPTRRSGTDAFATKGVHGIDAYRDTWPGFFWQRMGASFEIESLDVVAGDDVAFAYACCAAAPRRSSRTTRTTGCGSRWACARRTAAGSSHTSITVPALRPGGGR